MPDTKEDPELNAMATLLSVLEPLSETARANVLDYVFRRLGIKPPVSMPVDAAQATATIGASERSHPIPIPDAQLAITDIRALREQKKPVTASEMVAVIAYFLEHLAPPDEKRDFITADDVKPYFTQAGFPLPKSRPQMTLVNAKNAGYLDARERGSYKLNPVGHNLVAHKMPHVGTEETRPLVGARRRSSRESKRTPRKR